MRYKVLGKTGLFVSEICLGTMTFAGKVFWEKIGRLGTKEAESLVGIRDVIFREERGERHLDLRFPVGFFRGKRLPLEFADRLLEQFRIEVESDRVDVPALLGA